MFVRVCDLSFFTVVEVGGDQVVELLCGTRGQQVAEGVQGFGHKCSAECLHL